MTAPKRLALNMKATPALRARIEGAAQESGLSIAQEVERRLIASFDYQDAADYLRQADMVNRPPSEAMLNEGVKQLEYDADGGLLGRSQEVVERIFMAMAKAARS